ncbi:hypothetical protein N5K21_29355 [Rhizobium pusense]|uniref:hypothetical protein n=1 Tax=Agrobacterium pusense TaxID=648995 RepID=UPI00244B97A1|nr:hypothetical protein [Agrobacterium pusense]MDH2092797.1 hypothetical protein [Agrobacterium pusense]
MVTKAGEKLIEAAKSGVGAVHFLNPFTGETEPFVSREHSLNRVIEEASKRIAELQEEIREIKAFLVL